MGTAMIAGLVNNDAGPQLLVVEATQARRDVVRENFGIDAQQRYDPGSAEAVILAIQPQQFSEFAMEQVEGAFDDTLVVSVMAGVGIPAMTKLLGTARVIRSIPNTPSEVGNGMTVLSPGSAATSDDTALAEILLSRFGRVLTVSDEALMDDATALCGGGPAFVAHIAGAFCDFAVKAGFLPDQARLMTYQVLRGTAELLGSSDRTPQELCSEVMTPGGTTEQGIFHYRDKGLQEIIVEGLSKAAHRSRELGGMIQ